MIPQHFVGLLKQTSTRWRI